MSPYKKLPHCEKRAKEENWRRKSKEGVRVPILRKKYIKMRIWSTYYNVQWRQTIRVEWKASWSPTLRRNENTQICRTYSQNGNHTTVNH